MALDNSQFNDSNDISRFLEKFSQDASLSEAPFSLPSEEEDLKASAAAIEAQHNKSFEKLEEKIRELEEKFEVSSAQHEAVMKELARTRQAVEKQQTKDAFLANIAHTIENLKQSVENLSRAQRQNRTYEPLLPSRAFDAMPVSQTTASEYLAMSAYLPDNYRLAQQNKLQEERREKEEAVSRLEAERREKDQALADLAKERDAHEQTEEALVAERREKQQVLADLKSVLTSREQTVSQLEEERKAKEQALSDLSQVRGGRDLALAQLQGQMKAKDQVLADLTAERAARAEADAKLAEEREEKNKVFSSLQQKTSQLKAVNVALDREIKRVQQEKMEALRKSAEQAKEILSLRDALTQAEENFKSFDFEGRIISVKRQYEQKVNTLETQLHEISDTCMKQVEEIESLKAENLKLHQVAEEREQLAALYEAKTRELEALKSSVLKMRNEDEQKNQARLAAFTHRMQRLQEEHQALAERLTQAQQSLQMVSAEKQTLENNFKVLLSKIEKNDAVIESLKQKIAVLTAENKELRARYVAQPEMLRPLTPQKTVLAVKKPEVQPALSKVQQDKTASAETAPVEMQNTMRSKLKTEADLPEIRVAKPVEPEELYNGEDFLEKTDSFIGRMKWSIFREDK